MKKIPSGFLVLLISLNPLFAEEPPASSANSSTLEAQLSGKLAQFNRIDEQIEARVSELVAGLENIQDSRVSKMQVIEMKRKTLRALREIVDYYHERINRLTVDLTQILIPEAREDIAKQIQYFYERLERRIADIVSITASLSAHQGGAPIQKQNEIDQISGLKTAQGGAARDEARNADLLQARADAIVQTVKAELKQDAINLKQRAKYLQSKAPDLQDEQILAMVKQHIATLEASVATRLTQIQATTVGTSGASEVGNREAQKIGETLQSFGQSIREDYQKMDDLRQQINEILKNRWSEIQRQ